VRRGEELPSIVKKAGRHAREGLTATGGLALAGRPTPRSGEGDPDYSPNEDGYGLPERRSFGEKRSPNLLRGMGERQGEPLRDQRATKLSGATADGQNREEPFLGPVHGGTLRPRGTYIER